MTSFCFSHADPRTALARADPFASNGKVGQEGPAGKATNS